MGRGHAAMSREKLTQAGIFLQLLYTKLFASGMPIFYIVFPNGEHAFTSEQRIAARWAAQGATVIENPVDAEGQAFTGAPDQTLSVETDELGALVIDVTQHEDIPAASAAVVASPVAESGPTALELLAERVMVLEAENMGLAARLVVLERWARTLTAG